MSFTVHFTKLQTWEFHYVTDNQIANFEMNLEMLCQILWECFTIALGCCFEMSTFTVQRKAIPSFVRQKIIESWLEWKGTSQIGQELRLLKQTIPKFVDNFVHKGNIKASKKGNKTPTAHTDDVNINFI